MLKKLVFTETSLQGPKERALPKNLVVTLQTFFKDPKSAL
jgi:hypothetical protein